MILPGKPIRRGLRSTIYKPIPKTEEKNNLLPLPVPKGCLPIYVGEECKRYVVPLKYLTSPLLQALLYQSDEALEPKIDGPITLTCTTTQTFEEVLKLVAIEQLQTDGCFLWISIYQASTGCLAKVLPCSLLDDYSFNSLIWFGCFEFMFCYLWINCYTLFCFCK